MAAKVTSRTEVLQSLLTLLYSLLTLLHSAAEPQRQASQGFDDRGVLHFTILQGTAVQQDEGPYSSTAGAVSTVTACLCLVSSWEIHSWQRVQ